MNQSENNQIVYQKNGKIEYIQFKRLLDFPNITHAYTLRSGEELNFRIDNHENIEMKKSFHKICEELNLDETKVVKPHQTHTNKVEVVNEVIALDQIDGVITNQNEIIMATTSADCTSLLLYDPIKEIIGSIHSGWRGTANAIAKNAIKKMVSTYDCSPKDIIACICPTIRKCCFEVEEDVKEIFIEQYGIWQENWLTIGKIEDSKQKYNIDTVWINKKLLEEAGLQTQNIIDSEICTVCNSKDFHSYRVDRENSGRNAAIICKIGKNK